MVRVISSVRDSPLLLKWAQKSLLDKSFNLVNYKQIIIWENNTRKPSYRLTVHRVDFKCTGLLVNLFYRVLLISQ